MKEDLKCSPAFSFLKTVIEIRNFGNIVSPRGSYCKELLGFYIEMNHPKVCISSFDARKYSFRYLAAELLWYFSGDLKVTNVQKFAELWGKISSEEGYVNSNYGHIVFHKPHQGKSQFQIALDEIIADNDTRQSIIRYNSLDHQYQGNKDKPCTLTNQFLLRNKELNIVVNMRSNDIFYGFQYDVVWASILLQAMTNELNKKLGEITCGNIFWNAGSMHLYENMFDTSAKIVEQGIQEAYSLELVENIYNIVGYTYQNQKDMWERLEKIRYIELSEKINGQDLYIDFIQRCFGIVIKKVYG